ncbi:E3 ubiquitin-protein ligase TRIM56-like [Lingula anatina]|uniref:E3 ubiquitin-protein ligase TRIM56-like n=1 Tax=Lingula anatina TaxID=7574 RepID=A0A1S3K645_LINAN|nr:E3 ubiquitin-protein ligase TRIM56-like [Lingula anatina]|eukprot:XP_013417982.1 E3 ubiquitin-protein ligase TRIM56-like [Lingula anatina]
MATAAPECEVEDNERSLRSVITENFVNCPICLVEYTDPTDLPCQHTFCKGCLSTLISDLKPGSKFSCPVCQREIEVPENGLEGFKHNFFVESLQDTVLKPTKKAKCSFCALASETETVATSKCITCHDYLCEKCSKLHCSTRFTKDHKVLTFQQIQSEKYQKIIQEQQVIFCPEHKDEPLRYYCVKCEKPVCRDCKILSHDDHKVITLSTASENASCQLQSRLEELETEDVIIQEAMGIVDEISLSFQENKKSIKVEISQRADNLCQLVRQKEKAHLEEVDGIFLAEMKNLNMFHDHFSGLSSRIKSDVNAVRNTLKRGVPLEVLMLEHQLRNRIDELQHTTVVTEIPKEYELTFKTNQDVDQDISGGAALGKIYEELRENRLSQECTPEPTGEDDEQPSNSPSMVPVPQVKPTFKSKVECVLEFDTGCYRPGDISISPTGEYVTVYDTEAKLNVFSSDGTFKTSITSVSGTKLQFPVGICHFPDGRMIVSDNGNNKLFMLSSQWEVLQTTCVQEPWGVALNDNYSEVAVARLGTARAIRLYDIDRERIALTADHEINSYNGTPIFDEPYKVAYMKNGCIIACDDKAKKVHILSPAGEPLYQYTGPDNNLGSPHGVCVDAYDNILVTDIDNHCIHLVSRDGKFIRYIVTKADGLCDPWACTINQGGDLVVTEHDGKLKVYRYLKN